MGDLLSTLGLSAEAVARRTESIGGSDANTILSGDEKRILSLWRQKRGEEAPEDLSDNLAVQMGSFTEPLNIAWFEKQTGRKVILPERMKNGGIIPAEDRPLPFMTCTLDGWVTDTDDEPEAVFEAKHCGTRNTDSEIFSRYCPQLTHNCLCTGARHAFLSVFKGNGDWFVMEYLLDDGYAAALVAAERDFWECVRTGTPPCPLPPPPAPKPVGVVEYDMSKSNSWASHAADYLETVLAADRHETAKKAIKELVPADASKCFGHGITVKRDKRGALRFTTEGEQA